MNSASKVLVSLLVLAASSAAQIFVTTPGGCVAGQVVPPTSSTATGTASATLDLSTNMLSWNVSWTGLQGTVTAAHFHGPAMPGQNAGVQVNIGTANPAVGSALLSPTQVQQVLGNLWYVNIHSTAFPGGEIRGQLVRDPQVVTAFGLEHGNAGLAVLDASGGGLTVSNIGSSGEDGVSIDLEDTEFLEMRMQFSPGSQPFEGNIVLETRDASMNPIAGLVLEPDDQMATTELRLGASPPWASQVEVVLLDECGAEVLSGRLPANPGTVLGVIDTEILTMDLTAFALQGGAEDPATSIAGDFNKDDVITMSIPGTGTAMAHGVEVRAVGTAPLDAPLGELQAMATGFSSFTILDEAIGVYGNAHRTTGAAEFEYDGMGNLTVSNIGSSGEDGVSIQVPGAEDIFGCPGETVLLSELQYEEIPMPMPNGAQRSFSFMGDAGFQVTQTLTQIGPGVVSMDVTHSIACPNLCQVWDDGSLVLQVSGLGETIGTANKVPMGVDTLLSVVTFATGPTHGMRNRYATDTMFDLGGQMVVGDELRILAEGGAPVDQGPAWTFEVTGQDVPPITLTGDRTIVSDWADLGNPLAGAAGDPVLKGYGRLVGGELMALELTNAAPSAPCVLFVSFASNPAPFKGGILCTVPPFITLTLATAADGSLQPMPPFPWPPAVPSGATIYHQVGIADAGAPAGVALSNCLRATTP
ncbi:MAG: CHRD domain-containing protein [Planctomycetota bacterium]|jgi:hypothetical protein